MEIRREVPRDRNAVRAVHEAAFETSAEADIVEVLRGESVASLVAALDGDIVGHVLFSSVQIDARPDLVVVGLAPMAVRPALQRRGIGSALVRQGLDACRAEGCGAVIVLGHPGYYPRFGFEPASRYGLTCKYDVPDDVFMVIELERGYLDDVSGEARYADVAFGHS